MQKPEYVHVSASPRNVSRARSLRKSVGSKASPRKLSPSIQRIVQLVSAQNTANNKPGSLLKNEPNWHGDRTLLSRLVRTGDRIGAQSVHGVVRRLVDATDGTTNRWCIKTIKFRTPEKRKAFREEVRIGSLPHIEAVGPRIHAWRNRVDGAEYVMDNVEMGRPDAKTYSFYTVKKKYGHTFNSHVAQTLDNFQRLTKGEHGDFHGENILFVKNGRSFDIRIIDYGSWKSFTNTSARKIRVEKGVNVYRLANGRMFRHNSNMLEKLFK